MAYPMAQMPTFGDFRARVCGEFGCEFLTIECRMNGAPTVVRHFKRVLHGKTFLCAVQEFDDSKVLTPSVLRSYCARLKINPIVFGLTLG